MPHTIDVEPRHDSQPNLPEAVCQLLDFFDVSEPAQVVGYHRTLYRALRREDEASQEQYKAFNTALEVYPEDNLETPATAVALYEAFVESDDVVDRQLISGHLDRLWACSGAGALTLSRRLWIDENYPVYQNTRLAVKWAFDQGLIDKDTWKEITTVVPMAHWKRDH